MKFSLYKLPSSLLNYSPDNEPVLGRLREKTITRKLLEITTTTTTTDILDSQPVSRDFVGYGDYDYDDDDDEGCNPFTGEHPTCAVIFIVRRRYRDRSRLLINAASFAGDEDWRISRTHRLFSRACENVWDIQVCVCVMDRSCCSEIGEIRVGIEKRRRLPESRESRYSSHFGRIARRALISDSCIFVHFLSKN